MNASLWILAGVLTLAACERGGTTGGPTPIASVATASNVVAVVGGTQKHYEVAFAADPCSAGKDCTARVTLAIKDGFHVNEAYPYRFVATVAPGGPEFLGKDGGGPHVFSKAAGDFTQTGPTHASIAVRFRPKAKGPATIVGTYKLSVCSADTCLLENEKVEGQVDVR